MPPEVLIAFLEDNAATISVISHGSLLEQHPMMSLPRQAFLPQIYNVSTISDTDITKVQTEVQLADLETKQLLQDHLIRLRAIL